MKKRLVAVIITVVGTLYCPIDQNIQKIAMPKILPFVVIGSGPAGLSAAKYGAHLGIPTTLIAGDLPGGLLTQTSSIENYPGVESTTGGSLMDRMMKQTRERGVSIIEDTVVSVDLSEWPFMVALENGQMFRVLSLIVATGAVPKKLGIPGEETYWGNGISSCAICDAHFFKGKDVVVVGGGDSAVEEALILSPLVKSVTILVRSHRMRATPFMQRKLEGYPNIKSIEYNKRVTKVIGSKDEVTHLEVLDLLTDKKTVLPTDGLFTAIGHNPTTDLFAGQLNLSDSGNIVIDEQTQATSISGVFAAGDVEDTIYRQAIVAAGRGCKAAIKAAEWLRHMGVTTRSLEQLANS